MNVSISFPAEIESTLRHRAAAAGQDVATFVKEVVAEHLAEEEECFPPQPQQEDFAEWLSAWIKLHPVLDHAIDDSRESIYEGRGE